MSERVGGSRHPHHGRCPHRETEGHKDEDNKDAVTYQSSCWDLTMYHWAGCRDHTLLPYAICSLQGYLGELVRSLGMDITLDDVLNILDEHYNNIKALDVLNQELFQMPMGKKETVSDWRVCLSRHLQILTVSFPECFPLDEVAELKHDHFYDRMPKWLEAMVAYLKASAHEKTYSDYLRAAREAGKEEAMQPSQNQATDKPSKPKATSFFPLQKLKGTQPTKITDHKGSACGGGGFQRRGGHWKWRSGWYRWCDRGVYNMPGKSSKGDPEGWTGAVTIVVAWNILFMGVSACEGLQISCPFKLKGGDSAIENASLGPLKSKQASPRCP